MPEPIRQSYRNPYEPPNSNTCVEPATTPSKPGSAAETEDVSYFTPDPTLAELTSRHETTLQLFLKATPADELEPGAARATLALPNISAGTPAVNERPHASPSELVKVDNKGKPAGEVDAGQAAQRLTPEAAEAFRRLREYAGRDGIDVSQRLLAYSTFRSDEHQARLNESDPDAARNGFRAKAGASTHRTGNALDVTVSEGSPLDNNSSAMREQLHQDPASQWLEANADKFGFTVLGAVKHADGSITHAPHWEPWHITYNPTKDAALPPPLERTATP